MRTQVSPALRGRPGARDERRSCGPEARVPSHQPRDQDLSAHPAPRSSGSPRSWLTGVRVFIFFLHGLRPVGLRRASLYLISLTRTCPPLKAPGLAHVEKDERTPLESHPSDDMGLRPRSQLRSEERGIKRQTSAERGLPPTMSSFGLEP